MGLIVKKSLLMMLVAATAGAPVAAQSVRSTLPTLETLVVVASRTETPLREVAASVSVLDQEQIEAQGFASLADVLRSLPAVTVSNTGGQGKASSVSIRGEAGYRTLVRVDGVEITDPTVTQPGAQIQHLLSADVGQVELLRGPQGMMYGADAGGVLNISTRRVNGEPELQLSAEGGRYHSRNYHLGLGAGSEKLDYYVSATRSETDGFNARIEDVELADEDGYDNTTLHGRLGWQISDALRLQLVARDTDAEVEFDRCDYPEVDDCLEAFNQRNQRISLTHATTALEHELAYTQTDIERINYTSGEASYIVEGRLDKWELVGQADLSSTHGLVYGVDRRHDQVGDNERDQLGLFAEYQGELASQFFFTAGARRDDNDDFDTHTSYRASAAYVMPALSGEMKLRTSYGTGFRAPSLFEIDYNRSQVDSVLAPLDSELSKGLDVGVSYHGASGLWLEAVWFDQKIEQEIVFDMVNFSGYMQATGESRSRGWELNTAIPVSDTLVVNASYTDIDAHAVDGEPRTHRPDYTGQVSLLYSPSEKWKTALNWRAAGSTWDSLEQATLGSYRVWGASVYYNPAPALTIYLRGENIFDADYTEVSGYHTSGAATYVGLKIRL